MNTSTSLRLIEDVLLSSKQKLRELFPSVKEVIQELDTAYELETGDYNTICAKIKRALKEEIDEDIISIRQIERCCHDRWKKSTKPRCRRKNDILSFSTKESTTNHNVDDVPRSQRKSISSLRFRVSKEKFLELDAALKNSANYCYLRFNSDLELITIETDRT